MLSQNQSRYLVTIGFTLLASLFASDLLLKPPKELVLLAIDCISALYFTATLFVGLKERKKGSLREFVWVVPTPRAPAGPASGPST